MSFFEKCFGCKKSDDQNLKEKKLEQTPASESESRQEKIEKSVQAMPVADAGRDVEQWKKVICVAMDHVAEQMRDQAAQNIRLAKASIMLELPGTKNIGVFTVEINRKNLKHKMLTAGVVRRGSDYCIMHFIKSAENAEILAYLEDYANVDELYASLSDLSDKIDDRF